ncbi:helix-turn-helix domain-containing protein [Sungkyunkwania multivorans]|uniref:Helix-turn-helix domain-containing protein n=1 Tax=Sungkyunkwania multivorans TaxID=1173618 RepID=A0ABW3D1J7_9FLAO
MTSFFNFLLLAGVIQGFIFNIATFFSKKKVDVTIVYLNFVVFFLSLNNLQAWLIESGHIFSFFYLKHLLVPWYMLIFPMFYGFLINYLKIQERFNDFIKISLSIFIIEIMARTGIIVYSYYNQGQNTKYIAIYNNIEEIANAVYCIFIFVKAFIILFRYQQTYKFILQYDNIAWIKRFMYLGLVVVAFWIGAILLNNFVKAIPQPYTYYPLRLSSSILLYWIGYQGFFRYHMVKDRISLRSHLAGLNANNSKEGKKDLTEMTRSASSSDKSLLFKRVDAYVLNEKRYLDPSLSLEMLANELKISASNLSLQINSHSNYNFSDYINHYRVEKAKRLLADLAFAQYTNVAIGLECGFNSRSTFYASFKKFTGETPSSFREKQS